MRFVGIILIHIFFAFPASGLSVPESSVLSRFNEEAFLELRYYLENHSYPSFSEEDIQGFILRESLWDRGESTQFNQKDSVLFTLAKLEDELFDYFFESGVRPSLRIEMNRVARREVQIALHEDASTLLFQGALLSQYGSENVPAFISDKMVDVKASPKNSALSSIMADVGVVYEVYRPSNFDDNLIVAHEGFHSAMRRLVFINRQNRLQNLLGHSLGNGDEYDPWINQYVESLEVAAAPQLESLQIDERFLSDHHGVIMALIHHNIFQKEASGDVAPSHIDNYVTTYPFNYLSEELGLDESETLNRLEDLFYQNDNYVQRDQSLKTAIEYLSSHLLHYSSSNLAL